MRLTCFCIAPCTVSFLRRRRRRLRDFSCIPWLPPCLGRRTRPVPVTLNRLAAAFFVFIFGMAGPSRRFGEAAFSCEKVLFRLRNAGGRVYGPRQADCQAERSGTGVTKDTSRW